MPIVRVFAHLCFFLFIIQTIFSVSLPEGVPCTMLVNMTVDFFNSQPSLKEKLQNMREFLVSRHSHQVSKLEHIYGLIKLN